MEDNKKWVDCLKCKHHFWKEGHLWTCKQENTAVELDIETNLVICAYFEEVKSK